MADEDSFATALTLNEMRSSFARLRSTTSQIEPVLPTPIKNTTTTAIKEGGRRKSTRRHLKRRTTRKHRPCKIRFRNLRL